jgi:hypothetical protein
MTEFFGVAKEVRSKYITNTTTDGLLFSVNVNKTFTTAGDGLWSNKQKEVFVESISMFIGTEKENDFFNDGDLAINYTNATWNNDVDGLIYTDSAFLQQVKAFLINEGFDNDVVNAISYSEQGMQDDERVSCDANDFADYMRLITKAEITIIE